jgi:lysozyme
MTGGDDPGSLQDDVRVCAGASTVPGIDVSVHNGHIDWTKVKGSGQKFAVARVSDGLHFPDAEFAANWAGIKSVGMVRGVYQYFRPSQDPVAQADLMLSKIGTLGAGDLAPVIDVETADGVSGSHVVTAVRAWIDRVKAKTGVDPIIYAASGFWNTLPNTTQFAGEHLWVANYGASCPSMPKTWGKWSIWQSSESGSVPGVSGGIDVDQFNGSLSDLLAFAHAGSTPPATCAADADCNHGAPGVGVVCSNTGATAGQCIDGCHADGDCAAGASCDTTPSPWQCSNATPALGTPCTDDATCSDGQPGTGRVCGAGNHTCIVGCHDTGTDCPAGTTCNQTGAAWFCAPGGPSTLPLGAACTSDAQCGSAGQQAVCGASSHVCVTGCHVDGDCPSGDTCSASTNQCGMAPPPSSCPVLTYPSGIKIQTVKDAATTASYTGHLKSGETAPTCFLDTNNLHDPSTNQTYDLTVHMAAHFQLSELVGTEISQGWGHFVLISPAAVASLEKFRISVGGPVSVNSGYRGPKHQESVCNGLCGNPYGCPGTCSNNSRHMWGDAFDLPTQFYNTTDTNLACQDGFKFTYLESGTHLHIDQNPAYATCVQQ